MKYILPALFLIAFISCTSQAFDADMRQIAAKDAIAAKTPRNRSFDVLTFYQDSIPNYQDSLVAKLLRYSMKVTFKDSNNIQQIKDAYVVFTADGKSILKSTFIDTGK